MQALVLKGFVLLALLFVSGLGCVSSKQRTPNSTETPIKEASLDDLRAYVTSIAYEKGRLLCKKIVYPIYLYNHGHMQEATAPIHSRHHPFYTDEAYRKSVLEWFILQRDSFKSAIEFEEVGESLTQLHSLYIEHLIASDNFSQGIRDCAIAHHVATHSCFAQYDRASEFSDDCVTLDMHIKNLLTTQSKRLEWIYLGATVTTMFAGGRVLWRVLTGIIKWGWSGIKLGLQTVRKFWHGRSVLVKSAADMKKGKQRFLSILTGFMLPKEAEGALNVGGGSVRVYYGSSQVGNIHPSSGSQTSRESTQVLLLRENILRRHQALEHLNQEHFQASPAHSSTHSANYLEQRAFLQKTLHLYQNYALIDLHRYEERLQSMKPNDLPPAPHFTESYRVHSESYALLLQHRNWVVERLHNLEGGRALNVEYEKEHLQVILWLLDKATPTLARRYSPFSQWQGTLPCSSPEDYHVQQLCEFHQSYYHRMLAKYTQTAPVVREDDPYVFLFPQHLAEQDLPEPWTPTKEQEFQGLLSYVRSLLSE